MTHAHNPGAPLRDVPLTALVVDDAEVERRASELEASAAASTASRVERMLLALRCMDLTTLSDDDTDERVRQLCGKAKRPLEADVVEALGGVARGATVGAVCVFHQFVPAAVEALAGSGIPVAAVAGGFPVGYREPERRAKQVRAAVLAGASEIDVVITRAFVHQQRWGDLYDEVRSMRAACGDARLKVILSTGDLTTLTEVARAAWVAMAAGADFIKTSTGRERVNATIPAGVVMARAILQYQRETGCVVGLKPAGGIRTAETALTWLTLVREELDESWLTPSLFRIGASGLLEDLGRELAKESRQGATGG